MNSDKNLDASSSPVRKAWDVLVWTARISWRASSRIVIARTTLAIVNGAFICFCCYMLWWGIDVVANSWPSDQQAVKALKTVSIVAVGLLILEVLLTQLWQHFSQLAWLKLQLLIQKESITKGSHADLMARKGLYAELFNMQAECYLQAGEKIS